MKLFAKTRTFTRRRGGVAQLVRDNYGRPSDWFALVSEVKERDQYRCVFCGEHETAVKARADRLECHHVIPLSRGGVTRKSNLATSCGRCHKKRPGHQHL